MSDFSECCLAQHLVSITALTRNALLLLLLLLLPLLLQEGRLVELKSQVNDIKNLALKQQLQQRLAALKADFQAGDGGDAVVWQL
jgi:hypothetical protein